MSEYLHSELTEKIIGVAIKVHKVLGAGYGEKIYQRALYLELRRSGILFEREKEISVYYGKVRVGKQILDFVVDKKVVVEIKKTDEISRVHIAQVASYLSATGIRLGLLLNFGGSKLEVKRVIK